MIRSLSYKMYVTCDEMSSKCCNDRYINELRDIKLYTIEFYDWREIIFWKILERGD